jgi:HEPN domain-containing protein
MNDTYRAALAELHTAQQQFEQADPEYIDVAIYRLQAAELRLEAVLMQLKGERAG